CGEEDHHSHIICIKCNKVAFGCFARCECNEFKEINEEQELETEPEEDDDNGDNDPKGMNLAIEPTNEVKDSTFITAEVYEKRINVLLNSGSHSSVITKMFLDEMKVNIDKLTTIKRFPNPHQLIEIKIIVQTKYDLELELEDKEDDTEPERILTVRQENKELRYCKVQIEERDKIIEITEEKKMVMGDLNETQK